MYYLYSEDVFSIERNSSILYRWKTLYKSAYLVVD